MKSKLALVWFAVACVLTALLVVNWRNSSKQKLLLEKLQVQVEKLDLQEKTAKARTVELEEESRRLRAELRGAEVDLNSTRAAYSALMQMTNRTATGHREQKAGDSAQPGGMASMLTTMMKDPQMRKALEQQQKMGIDMMYGSLFKQLQLTPEQQDLFKETLLAQQMTNMAQAGAMFDRNSTNRTAIAEKLAADRKQAEEQIKQVLGEEKFARYQEYNQTVSERMMLEQFGKQTELTPEQTEQLLGIIREEKKNMQINMGQSGEPGQNFQDFMNSNEITDRLLNQQAQVNQRVLERANELLTAEQLQKLGPVLENQLSMQRAGMEMARKMFGSPKEGESQ